MLNVNYWMHFKTFKFKILYLFSCLHSIGCCWYVKFETKYLDAFRMTLKMSIRNCEKGGEITTIKKTKRRDGERIDGGKKRRIMLMSLVLVSLYLIWNGNENKNAANELNENNNYVKSHWDCDGKLNLNVF